MEKSRSIQVFKFSILWVFVLLPVFVIFAPASWPVSGAEVVATAICYGLGFLVASILTQLHTKIIFKALSMTLAAIYGFFLVFSLYAHIY